MRLYHGSNVTVEQPRILPARRALDFGGGFYLTSSKSQATKWARSVTHRRREGVPTLNVYTFDEGSLEQLDVLYFESANEAWLDFVVANRKELPQRGTYDIVIGPVANDTTLPVINDYMDGRYPKRIAIELLMPQNLTDQYAFLSERALKLLSFERSELV